jgi:hypothetical protein
MEQVCAGCGYRSANRSFFRREKSGVFGRRKAFCQGCAPYRPTRIENLSTHSVWLFGIGVLLIASGLEGLPLAAGYIGLLSGGVGLSGIVTIIVHELGHVGIARLLGMKVVRVVIGSGPILVARQWHDIRLELRRFMLAGGMTTAYHQIESPGKWRQLVLLLGGAGANLLLLLLCTSLLAVLIGWFRLSNPFLIVPVFCLLVSQILVIIGNLFPLSLRRDRPGRVRDGPQIINLLRTKDFRRRAQEAHLVWQGMALLQSGRSAEAQAHFEQAHRLLPANGPIFSLLVHSASKAAGPQAAVRYYLEHCGEFGSENEGANAWAYANVAWNALLTQDLAMLPLADTLSQRSIAGLAAAPEVQGTRGAVLVAMGEFERGLALLREGVRGTAGKDEKAGFAPFLARGEQACGNSEMADEFERLGRHLSALSGSE